MHGSATTCGKQPNHLIGPWAFWWLGDALLPLTYGRLEMDSFAAFARDNLLTGAVVLAIIVIVTCAILRAIKQRERVRRAAAWRATRAEQDRIWNERVGTK